MNTYLMDIANLKYPDNKLIHKFGANFDIDTDSTPETVWTGGGEYPWSEFDSAQTLYCKSSSASDTTTLHVIGLDANYDELTETVTLSGTNAVSTTSTFKRVFRMQYDAENVGDITAHTVSASGTVVAKIDIGYAQTLMAIYTIPAGFTGYIIAGDLTINAFRDVQVKFFVREDGKPFRIAHMAEVRGEYRYDFTAPMRIEQKSDIDVRVDDVNLSNSRATSNFDIVLVKNP
jgi:hypothetical protein